LLPPRARDGVNPTIGPLGKDDLVSDSRTFAVVGAGLAGAKAVETLRAEGFDGRLLLFGAEAHRPYERPPLSKGYLLGKAERDSVFVHPAGWYAEHDVDLRPSTSIAGLDRYAHELMTGDGETFHYDKLLLATGATPRRLRVPGAELAGVHYLRTLDDSDALRAAFRPEAKVVVVGGGWIGLETAAAARAAGSAVTVLESAELPLLRVLGPRMAGVFADLHRANGVDLRCEVTVATIRPAPDDPHAVGGVELGDGTVLDAGVVVVGIGVSPNVDLARSAGLAVDDGVLVDPGLRTSDTDIVAAGDVANADHPVLGRRVRVEHWANALNQPAVAAKTMLGADAVYDRLPYFFTDQYDLGMEYLGYAEPDDDVVVYGDLDAREFVALWTRGARVVAGMNVNVWDVTDRIRELILSGKPADAFESTASS
jgi:3-phenylpropionate/trans-cinnamate dioxygenase ferredoxin reductase component